MAKLSQLAWVLSLTALAYAQYTNPVHWYDYPDLDVFRVDDTYYASASNMHFSPGAPILRSFDLANWEAAGHSIPRNDFGPGYDLENGQNAYVKGSWASYLKYRPSNGLFYWGGCVNFNQTWFYTASSVEGPWESHPPLDKCYYDAGLLVDDDDTMYVTYGSKEFSIAQLTPDGLGEVKSQVVYSSDDYIEGSRMYKINGTYYIFYTQPVTKEGVLRSTGGPFGPYEQHDFINNLAPPVDQAGPPHQGGIVDTPEGDWYYLGFIDAYPEGRVPVLAPFHWSDDGWPSIEVDGNGGFGAQYPMPNIQTNKTVRSPLGIEYFNNTQLNADWEWNHNPDNSKWSFDPNGGLTLSSATVTEDLYMAQNTLTRRIAGPASVATIELDYSKLGDGDRAGLVLLRDMSAWIGVVRDDGATRVVFADGINMDNSWHTVSNGTEVASKPVDNASTIWLRATANVAPSSDRLATFEYSTDGQTFESLADPFYLDTTQMFFTGYRFGIFMRTVTELGGSVTLKSFELELA